MPLAIGYTDSIMNVLPRLDRYILSNLLTAGAVVALSLCLVIWLSQSLRFVDLIVNRGVSIRLFLQLAGMIMPSFLNIVLPIALLVAILAVYNRLSHDSELTVMRGAGLSPLQLARPALLLGVVLTMVGYANTLYFLPLSYTGFKDLQFDIRNNYASALLQEGVFTPINEAITVYVGSRARDGGLRDIIVHDKRALSSPVTTLAREGAFVRAQGSTNPRIILIDGNRQEMDVNAGRLTTLYFDRYTLDLSLFDQEESARGREHQELFLHELLNPDASVPERSRGKFMAAGHSRLLTPLYTLTYAMIGLVLLLKGDFSRRGQQGRIALAVLLVALCQAAAIGVENTAARHLSLIPLMYLTWLLPTALAYVTLTRHPRKPMERVVCP